MHDEPQISAERLQADFYTHHLYLAHFGKTWAEAIQQAADEERSLLDSQYLEGYARALRDIVSHLEAGEALPGGPLYTCVGERIAGEGPRV